MRNIRLILALLGVLLLAVPPVYSFDPLTEIRMKCDSGPYVKLMVKGLQADLKRKLLQGNQAVIPPSVRVSVKTTPKQQTGTGILQAGLTIPNISTGTPQLVQSPQGNTIIVPGFFISGAVDNRYGTNCSTLYRLRITLRAKTANNILYFAQFGDWPPLEVQVRGMWVAR